MKDGIFNDYYVKELQQHNLVIIDDHRDFVSTRIYDDYDYYYILFFMKFSIPITVGVGGCVGSAV